MGKSPGWILHRLFSTSPSLLTRHQRHEQELRSMQYTNRTNLFPWKLLRGLGSQLGSQNMLHSVVRTYSSIDTWWRHLPLLWWEDLLPYKLPWHRPSHELRLWQQNEAMSCPWDHHDHSDWPRDVRSERDSKHTLAVGSDRKLNRESREIFLAPTTPEVIG
jgi:hypothetical protein